MAIEVNEKIAPIIHRQARRVGVIGMPRPRGPGLL